MIKNPLTEIVKPEQTYYIPHHAVLCDSSAITRLRVGFMPHQTSLNDHMLIDPKLTEGFSYCSNALAPILLRVYRR